MMKRTLKPLLLLLIISPFTSFAGEADVVNAVVKEGNKGFYSFSVTVKHGDEGWEHYADRWEVLTVDGEVLGTRVLYHPHVGDQPFTRSLSGVKIPAGTLKVVVRAHDSVHGFGGETFTVEVGR